MYEKFDDLFGRYIEISEKGQRVISEIVFNGVSGLSKVFYAIVGVLIMVFSFPLWLIGVFSAEQNMHSDASPLVGDKSEDTSGEAPVM